jgi:hypothetical protein
VSAKIQSIAPLVRPKFAWYQENMAPLVQNDTEDLHWKFGQHDSESLIGSLFPDGTLSSAIYLEDSTASSQSLSVSWISSKFQEARLHIEENGRGRWAKYLDPATMWNEHRGKSRNQTDDSEQVMAQFLNDTLDQVERFMKGKFHE